MRRALVLSLIATLSLSANYHFVKYSNQLGFQKPIYEKFDLNALVNKTVPFFIVPDGLEKVADGDNRTAVMSNLIAAGRAWNDVSTSELRVAFGGYAPAAAIAPQASPGIDIVFEDVAPGIISYAGPTLKAETTTSGGETFTPILRSQIIFRKDVYGYKSFSDNFFLNAVHEFGHALGLQHTFTSSAMSTQLTRATTRSKPLAADDVAGISILYPSRNFQTLFGSVAGRITQNGQGVNLASVVALSLTGTAVSTLSNPDGTYLIQGIPPGPYIVYAHPVPPPVTGEITPGNLILPRDPENNALAANNLFDLQFFPGTRDAALARSLDVLAGQTAAEINFAVNRRQSAPTLFYPSTFSVYGSTYIRPAFISPQTTTPLFVATGYGFVTPSSQPVPGLRSTILGGSPAINGTRGFQDSYLIFDLFLSGFLSDGERHLVLDNGTETTVLPSAIVVSTRRPPQVSNVAWAGNAADGSRLAILSGANFDGNTRVYIDGELAPVRSMDGPGSLTVQAPVAAAGHVARVLAVNSDGQSSLLLQADNPVQLAYNEGETGNAFTIVPNVVMPGTETVVEINAPGARFAAGRVRVGFGTSDLTVRALQVVSSTRLLASVVAAPQAASGLQMVTVLSGLNHMELRSGFQVASGVTAAFRAGLGVDPKWTLENGSPFVTPGSNAVVNVPGLVAARVTASLNGEAVPVLGSGGGRVVLSIPGSTQPGFALLRLETEGETITPALVPVYGPAAFIQKVESSEQFVIDSARPAVPGDTLSITFLEPSVPLESTLRANEVSLQVGTATVETLRVTRLGANLFQSTFVLPKGVGDGNQSVAVVVNGRPSPVVALPVRNR